MNSTRRRFLIGSGLAALGFTPVWRLPWTKTARANPSYDPRFLVVVNLIGGNDGVNTVVPTHLAPYYDRRPTLAVRDDLHELGGGHALHPLLPTFKELWDAGSLRIVQKAGLPSMQRSHFVARDIFSLGVSDPKLNADGRGWLGRLVDTYYAQPVDPLAVIAVGGGRRPVLQAASTDPLVISRIERLRLEHDKPVPGDTGVRWHFIRKLLAEDEVHDKPLGAFAQQSGLRAFDLVDKVIDGTEGWVDPGLYPDTTLGGHLRTISKLRHGGFGTRVYATVVEGFDTHAGQKARHEALLREVDGALRAFRDDMVARGEWDNVAILFISEFGRRHRENGSAGTDHGHGNAFFVTGGAARGGMTGDLMEDDLLADQTGVDYDFRQIYSDLVAHHLDLDPAPLFPEPFQTTDDLRLFG